MEWIAIAKTNRPKPTKTSDAYVRSLPPRNVGFIWKLLVFCFLSLLFALNLQAQKVTITRKNAVLTNVLKEIERQTGYHFIYTNEMIQLGKPVNIDLKDATLQRALEEAFRSQPFTYVLMDKNIVVKNKTEAGGGKQGTPAVPARLQGKVTDENGKPMQGVSVTLKSENKGVQTDNDGNFAIVSKNSGPVVLEFGYIGYKDYAISADGSTPLSIKLQTDLKVIEDVVVVGYQSINRKEINGSVSSVNAKALKDIPVSSSLEALTGRLAGVQIVTSDGAPGADAEIKVRGGGSITQDNSPLYIIDGVQVENGLNYIAPQDIESVNVLKDAATTAIYGARGANGVVIITTKSGKEGKTVVSANSFVGMRKLANKLDVMDTYNFVIYQSERTRGSYDDSLSFVNSYGTWDQLAKYKDYPTIDWQQEVFGRNALMQTHNVSFSGGNKASQFNLSATYNKEDGVLIYTGYERKLVNFKFNHAASDKLSLGFSMRYNNQFRDGGGAGGTNSEGLTETSKLRSTIKYRPILNNSNLGFDEFDENYFQESGLTNPIVLSRITYKKQYNDAVNIGANLNYAFTKYLSFRATIGYDINTQKRNSFDDPVTSNARKLTTTTDGVAKAVVRVIDGSLKSINQSNVLTFSNTKLSGAFSKKHRINFLVGQETYRVDSRSNDITLINYPTAITPEKALGQLGLGTPVAQNPIVSEGHPFVLSYFSKIDYSFNRKYAFDFSIREDFSSKFGDANKKGFFPAGSVSWRISQERFMKRFSAINDLKLRVSYGIAGNNRIGDYLYFTTMSTYLASGGVPVSYGLNNNSVAGYVSSNLANSFLKWETSVSKNLGLDVALFKNRMTITIDAYQNDGKDLLIKAPIPGTSGYTTQLQNAGTTRNQGVELQLSGDIISKKKFTWTASLNNSFNKNTIRKLASIQPQYELISGWQTTGVLADFMVAVNNAVGTIYGFESDGFYTLDDFDYDAATRRYTPKAGVVNTSYFGVPQPGMIKVKDLGGPDGKLDGKADADYDRKILGNTNPKFFGGLNQQFTYKNFDLSVFVNYSYGNKILNASKIDFSSGVNLNSNMLGIMENRWKTVDENGKQLQFIRSANGVQYIEGEAPSVIAAVNTNANIWMPIRTSNLAHAVTSWAVEDGSFLRINNITLGYNLPSKLLSKIKIKSARFYATVNNLATITGYTGSDPEVNTQRGSRLTPGVDYSAYPRTHSYIFGVNLSF